MAHTEQKLDTATSADKSAGLDLSRRHIIMGVGMLVVGGAAMARRPKRRFTAMKDAQFEALFPKAFGDWRVLPSSELIMPPESELADKLYQNIMTRTYVNSKGEGMMLLAAYNSEQINNVQVHRPEVCYRVSGFAISDTRPMELKIDGDHMIPARIVRAERSGRVENIVYWTRIGDDFPQSWFQQRIAMSKANIKGFYPDGLLVRASAINNDTEQSVEQISGFLLELSANCSAATRKLAFRA